MSLLGEGSRPRLRWIPAFVVGGSAAAVGELAGGILLYSTEGFVGALTLVLVTELGALALGLATAPRPGRDGVGVEAIRRRWLLMLVFYTAAAVFSGTWSLLGGFAAAPAAQGLGLALLSGLPLYGAGSLLGAMRALEVEAGEPEPSGRGWGGVGAAAFAGAACAVLAVGLVLLPRLQAPSILLVFLIGLSAAALLHGWLLDERPVIRLVEELPSPLGAVRVEEWRGGGEAGTLRVLLEHGRVRGVERSDGSATEAWEEAVVELARDRAGPAGAVLVIGGGTFSLPRALREVVEDGKVAVLEENPEITRAARRHFSDPVAAGVEVLHGEWAETWPAAPRPWDMVVVDARAHAGNRPLPNRPRRVFREMRERTAEEGVIVLGPLDGPAASLAEPLADLLRSAAEAFPALALYGGTSRVPERLFALLSAAPPDGAWPEALGSFRRVELPRTPGGPGGPGDAVDAVDAGAGEAAAPGDEAGEE